MKQLQAVQRVTPGTTTSEARELTGGHPTGLPGKAAGRVPDSGRTIDGHGDRYLDNDPEKEAADKQVRELATQLELAQLQLEKVRTKADLEAAFADLDTIQAQLDKEHESSKLQERVRALEKEIRAMRRQVLLRPSSPRAPPGQASSGGPSGNSQH
ncbi:hypothetical protein R1flu_018718 [Riccia fluitans]|uniref:Uncharacterized protein n=1 Tax=Riccia fluitans TaxID=41844 RepID=A0ABD1ZGZ7_9MARC